MGKQYDNDDEFIDGDFDDFDQDDELSDFDIDDNYRDDYAANVDDVTYDEYDNDDRYG